MQSLTVDPKNIFYRNNSIYGYVEVVDAASGQVLAVQKDYNENFILGKMDELLEVEIDGQKILMQKGITLSNYKPTNSKFSRPLADLILQEVMENGTGITKACLKYGVQYNTLMRWAETFEDFGKELDKAKRYRADKTHDEVNDIAEDLRTKRLTKTEVEALKAAADLKKWSAEKSDPNRFGGKVDKNTGTGAVQIIINTGISREEPTPTTIEVAHESK